MLYRTLGRTGEEVSLIGLGGARIGFIKDEEESIALIRTAIDRGITFPDTYWDYNDGSSGRRMGKALQDGHRWRRSRAGTKSSRWRRTPAAPRACPSAMKGKETERPRP